MSVINKIKQRKGCFIFLLVIIILLSIIPVTCTREIIVEKKIKQAINNYDFETAHKRISTYSGIFVSSSEELMEECISAEVIYNAKNGYFNEAIICLREANLDDETAFNIALKNNLYDLAIAVLAQWNFEESFKEYKTLSSREPNPDKESAENSYYNQETFEFNKNVDAILNVALTNRDKNLAIRCLPLYRPTAKVVQIKKGEKRKDSNSSTLYWYDHEYTFALKDIAKEAAQKRIKAAGL